MLDFWRRRTAPASVETPNGPASAPEPATAPDPGLLRERVVAALREIYDPEIPVNIYDLGLIYGLDLDPAGRVAIRMTLTAPACPVAHTFPGRVEAAVRGVAGVSDAQVELVWEPRWDSERMSEEARLQLGWL
jgi:FeS assembly SUF system protein